MVGTSHRRDHGVNTAESEIEVLRLAVINDNDLETTSGKFRFVLWPSQLAMYKIFAELLEEAQVLTMR